ncbi:MAG: hypothetical protein MAG431_00517 [Chloroflexi bacterium]|nr:hypothetical protein [Chloroflexota bacterium]
MKKINLDKVRRLKQFNDVWEGTTRQGRFWVTPKDRDPYRPYYINFVSNRGKVLSTSTEETQPTLDQVWEKLLKTMRRPMLGAGRRRRPKMVVMDDEQLVADLAPRLAKLDIQCQYRRQLPHLENVLESLEQRMNRNFPEMPSLLSVPNATIPLLEHIFTASAKFYRLAPWEILPYEIPLEICYPREAKPRYAVVIGMNKESYGISVNDNWEDVQMMLRGKVPDSPSESMSWVAFSYELPIALAYDDLDAISRYDWPIPNPQAYPSIVRANTDKGLSRPTRQDIAWLEGALPALNIFFENQFGFDESSAFPGKYELSVQTISGPAKVLIQLSAEDI